MDAYRNEYGFFASTLFWTRMDTLKPIIVQKYGPQNFDPEEGQIDATFAHMIERLLCICPEIEKRKMYEIRNGSIYKIPYESHNIPAWADVYVGNIVRDKPDISKI